MAQANQNIQNLTFPAVRAQINDNLAALYSTSSGPSAPSQTKPHQLWVDTSTSPPVLKVRDGVTEEFHPVGILDPGGFKPSGVTPIANGGTGQNTVAAAIAALLPSQTGNADKALLTNGTSLLWGAITSSSFTKYTFAAGTGTGSTRTHLWTKPSTGSIAVVLIWGGGGAGGRDGSVGGGGGAGSNCGFGLFPLADLGSTETITLGRGGQGRSGSNNDGEGADGTNSTFGSHATSYGGRGGDDDDGFTAFGSTPFTRGALAGFPSSPAFDLFSGGNGGTQKGDNDSGGNAVFGGAGGGNAGINDSVDPFGGASIIAGNGGRGNRAQGDAVNGSTPGGGGGGSQDGTAGSGGDGECWVLIF